MAIKNLLSEKRLKPVDISTAKGEDFDQNAIVLTANGMLAQANPSQNSFGVINHPDLFKPLSGVQSGDIPKGYAYIDSATGKIMEADAATGAIQEHNALWGALPTIKTNEAATANNALAIGNNTTSIGNNTTAISTNTSAISTNASDISTNAADIASNAGEILINKNSIATNSGNISTNASNISTNTGNISTNTSDIATLDGFVTTNKNDISSLGITVGNNTTAISTNTTNISTNTSDISTNASGISTLSGKVSNGFTASGLANDGTFVSFTTTNYLNASTSLTSALDSLDSNLFTVEGGLQNLTLQVGDLETSASNLITSVGGIVDTDGSWLGFSNTNYINGSGDIAAAIKELDKELGNVDKSEFHAIASGSYATNGLGVFEASADIKNGSGSPTVNTVSYDEILVMVDNCEIDTQAVENGLANEIYSTATIYNYDSKDLDITYKSGQTKRFLDVIAWTNGVNAGTTSAGASDLPDAITVGAGQKVKIYIAKDPYGITTAACVGYFLVESI